MTRKMEALPEGLKLSKGSQDMAKFLAMLVRNGMEDFHHNHLSDEQMKELNPIIRNAIYTGLHALRHCRTSKGAKAFVYFHWNTNLLFFRPEIPYANQKIGEPRERSGNTAEKRHRRNACAAT